MRICLVLTAFLVALVVAEVSGHFSRRHGHKRRGCEAGGRGNRGGRGGRLGSEGNGREGRRGRGHGKHGKGKEGGRSFGYGGRGVGGAVYGGFRGGRKGHAYGWGSKGGGGEGGTEVGGLGEGPGNVDIIFLVDSSGSVKKENFRKELDFIGNLAKKFRVGEDDRVRFGAVAYSKGAKNVFGLGEYQGAEGVGQAIRKTPFLKSKSNLGKGLKKVLDDNLFGPEKGGRDGARKILVFFTDGKSSNRGRTVSLARRLRKLNVEILPIGIGRASLSELRGCANVDRNVFKIRGFDKLEEIEDDVADRIVEAEEEEPIPPAEEENNFPALADILFILDAADGLTPEAFSGQKSFAAGLARQFVLGPEASQIAGTFYSDEVGRLFDLFDFYVPEIVADNLNGVDLLGGGRNTGLALSFATEIFRADRGDRDFARDVIVLFVGGAFGDAASAAAEAEALRGRGIRIICIGFGGAVDAELQSVASGAGYVFWISDFTLVDDIENSVAEKIVDISEEEEAEEPAEEEPAEEVEEVLPPTEAPPPPPPPPPSCADEGNEVCQQGCEDGDEGYVCVCDPGYEPWDLDPTKCENIDECEYIPSVCQQNCLDTEGSFICSCDDGFVVSEEDNTKCNEVEVCHLLGDIIVVMDSSGSIGDVNFETQKEFVRRISTHFPIGVGDARFGSVVFSYNAQKLFDLKDFNTAEEVEVAISQVPWLRSLTYTNKALDLVREQNMFSEENGGRAEAADIIILITDGASTRSDLTLPAAQALKDSGVTIICLGIGDGVDEDELKAVASTPDDVLIAATFDLLPVIEQRVADRTCNSG